jgi:hypothetical protein
VLLIDCAINRLPPTHHSLTTHSPLTHHTPTTLTHHSPPSKFVVDLGLRPPKPERCDPVYHAPCTIYSYTIRIGVILWCGACSHSAGLSSLRTALRLRRYVLDLNMRLRS